MLGTQLQTTRSRTGPLGRPSTLLALLLLTAGAAAAEEPGANAEAAASTPSQTQPDFRFSVPGNSFGVRGGWTFNRAEGEIYDFLTDQLTLRSADFNAPTLAVDFSWRLSARIDAVIGFEYSSRSKRSEFRDFVDTLGIPIVQDTRLTQVPLTLSLKLYLTDRGRQVGRYAWVPASVIPYVGAGAGYTWYRLEQDGEFVDFVDLSIFEDRFVSDGWTIAAHAFAGLELKLNPSLGLVVEGRYQWASTDLGDSFVGFEPIDLNGARAMVGVNWKF